MQPDARTVQGVLRDAARRLAADARVTGASRTDAGVHALRQVASLTLSSELTPRVVVRALNATLPGDVRVREAREAPRGFDARRAAPRGSDGPGAGAHAGPGSLSALEGCGAMPEALLASKNPDCLREGPSDHPVPCDIRVDIRADWRRCAHPSQGAEEGDVEGQSG